MTFVNLLAKKLEGARSYARKVIPFLVLLLMLLMPIAQVSAVDPNIVGGQNVNLGTGAVTKAPELSRDALACSITNPSICLANVIYAFTVGLGGGLAYVGGFMFDTTVSLSLNSAAYALDFLSAGWTTARDLANMAFILILVYIAFMIMFQAETAGTMKMLAWVIFIALIINFSFFFTRVVIDAGNIFAVQFYNAIDAPTMQKSIDATNSGTGVLANSGAGVANMLAPKGTLADTKDLTASIMNALNIQQLFNDNSFQAFARESGFGAKFIVLSFLYISIGACYFILAAMFFAVGVKFLVRIVVLWFLIIASPLAFICKAVPKPEVSGWYDKWQHELVNHAFYPVFFLFIFFFVSTVMKGLSGDTGIVAGLATDLNRLNSTTAAANGFIYIASAVANVGIRLGFVIAMLYIALKASEYMGVKGGELAHSMSSKITGAGIAAARFGAGLPLRGGAAAGGFLGRNTAGWAGNALSRSSALRNWEKGTFGFAARGVRNAGAFVGDRTFDIRNAPGGKSVLGLGGLLEVGSGTKDGYIKGVKAAADAKEKRAKDLEPTSLEKQEAQNRAESREKYDGKTYTERKSELASSLGEQQRDLADLATRIRNMRTVPENQRTEEGRRTLANAEQEHGTRTAHINATIAEQAKLEKIVKDRAKELSGEGLSKKYAEEALLSSFNVSARNPGFVTRSSREAALKILKGKSKDQEMIDAIKKFANGDTAAPAAAPVPAPAAAAPAAGTSHAFNRTQQPIPTPASTEKLERALEKLGKKLEDTAHTYEMGGEKMDRSFTGLRKTVQQVLGKNGSRNIENRGRSGRPIPADTKNQGEEETH